MFQTTNSPTKSASARLREGLTLVELLLVMALLTIVLAVGAPSLARFFRGRSLDSEARRLLSLTRYAQSRAVSEGMPMVLWIDEDQGVYGVEVESSYSDQDSLAMEFTLHEDLQLEVERPVGRQQSAPWKLTTQIAGKNASIRFTPDGFIGDNSPERIVIRQTHEGDKDEVWIGQTRNRLSYEIQTDQDAGTRRR